MKNNKENLKIYQCKPVERTKAIHGNHFVVVDSASAGLPTVAAAEGCGPPLLPPFRGLRPPAAADVVGRHVRSADGLHAPSRGGLSAHGASLARLAPDRRQRPRPARRQRRRSLSSHCKHLPSTHSYLIPHTWFIIYLTSFILSLVFSKYLSWIETPCAYRN